MEDAVSACRRIYLETADFYRQVQPRLVGNDCGFKILYGPPVLRPELFIIGYQPGGKKNDDTQSVSDLWPDKCEYAEPARYLLAKRIYEVLGSDVLNRSTGANRLFFRAPDMKSYHQIAPDLRREIDTFCDKKLSEIIDVLMPQRLLFIGLKSADRWLTEDVRLTSQTRRILGYEGKVGDIPALSVLHLTGARMSAADRDIINRTITQFASEQVAAKAAP